MFIVNFEVLMIQVVSKSREETEHYAEKLAAVLKGGEVIAFFGGLGMGKTCFTSGLARGLGLKSEVSSPTFSLVHDYGGNPPLYHFDMYRISTYYDLCTTGFFEYLDMGAVLAVEWSENIETALPEDNTIRIEISRGNNDDERILRMSGEKVYEDTWR